MITADLIVTGVSQLLSCRGAFPKRGIALRDVGVLEQGCIASNQGRIVFIGDAEGLSRNVHPAEKAVHIDGRGLTGLPGFVDPHNHLPFGGSREEEFNLRLQGWTYLELAEKGMGIQTTVDATRSSDPAELEALCLTRLDSMLLHGTTTTEAKSGYGLNLDDELKQLRVLQTVQDKHPIDIIPTFLGAHEIPREYKDNKGDYIDFLIQTVLPAVKSENLAEYCDAFCEEGVYSVEETRRLIKAAKSLGFKIKIHADEFAPLGGAILAAEEGATSADHLVAITEEGISALAESRTVASLLPGVSFFLMMENKAPARKLIEAGAAVALATDFNPGSSMTESMFFILQLGIFTLKLMVEEAINACTANAAFALDRQEDIGSLEPGKKMDLILCEAPNYLHLCHHLGINPVKHVIKDGRVVVKDRQLTYHTDRKDKTD